jgi:hypothetical protein
VSVHMQDWSAAALHCELFRYVRQCTYSLTHHTATYQVHFVSSSAFAPLLLDACYASQSNVPCAFQVCRVTHAVYALVSATGAVHVAVCLHPVLYWCPEIRQVQGSCSACMLLWTLYVPGMMSSRTALLLICFRCMFQVAEWLHVAHVRTVHSIACPAPLLL